MTAPIYTGYQQSLSYSAAKDRHIINGPMARRATANALSGVIPQATGAFNVSLSGFVLTITHGAAQVNGYWFIANGNTTITIEPVTGAARRDLLVAHVYDIETGSPTSEGKLEIIKGTTTADPAVPAGALILWQIDVPASGTALVLVDRRTYTAAAGAVKPVKGISNIVVVDQTLGTPLYDLDTGIHWFRQGSALQRMGAKQIDSFTMHSNANVESGGPSGAVWQIYQAGPITLPSHANIVQVTGTWVLTALTDARFDMKLAFDNIEILHEVVDSYGSSAGGDGDRTYTFTATIADRPAGVHDLCWIGAMCGVGGPIHIHGMSYSWVALG